MECKFCKGKCYKAGFQTNGEQRFRCNHCRKYQQQRYKYQARKEGMKNFVSRILCNSSGIRGTARVLKIAPATVIKYIRETADKIKKPAIPLYRSSFEIDELRTYTGHKQNQYWVAYVLCSKSKEVIDFIVGKRNKRTLRMVVNTALQSGVTTTKTDRLSIYRSLIPRNRHVSNAYNINYIERNNLNLRTHLKRLSRRTICFSKSVSMLEACLKIYFWGAKY